MSFASRIASVPTLAVAALVGCQSQPPEAPLTSAYTAEQCPPCAEWNAPQTPFRIFGNSYYVGTRGLGAILITSDNGHILIDGGLPNSAPLIIENIAALGFDIADVELILNSHAHYDHAGGIAALQRASGARVAASGPSKPVLEGGDAGPDDPQYGIHLPYPPVSGVHRFVDGESLGVGPMVVTAHLTPGHTRGGTSWSWRSCEGDRCLDLVYADSQTPVSADGFHFSDNTAYPTAVQDFERTHAVFEQLPCDILITPHPSASQLWERQAKGFVDRDACRNYAQKGRQQLEKRLQTERASR